MLSAWGGCGIYRLHLYRETVIVESRLFLLHSLNLHVVVWLLFPGCVEDLITSPSLQLRSSLLSLSDIVFVRFPFSLSLVFSALSISSNVKTLSRIVYTLQSSNRCVLVALDVGSPALLLMVSPGFGFLVSIVKGKLIVYQISNNTCLYIKRLSSLGQFKDNNAFQICVYVYKLSCIWPNSPESHTCGFMMKHFQKIQLLECWGVATTL